MLPWGQKLAIAAASGEYRDVDTMMGKLASCGALLCPLPRINQSKHGERVACYRVQAIQTPGKSGKDRGHILIGLASLPRTYAQPGKPAHHLPTSYPLVRLGVRCRYKSSRHYWLRGVVPFGSSYLWALASRRIRQSTRRLSTLIADSTAGVAPAMKLAGPDGASL